jgi:hypothetical protein
MGVTFFVACFFLINLLLKVVYLFFEPKMLNKEIFGPPKTKFAIAFYYVLAISVLVFFVLDDLGVIKFFVFKQ